VFAGLCQIHLGLGFLGIVGGGSNTGSIISNVFGFAFLVGGVSSLLLEVSKCDRQKRVKLLVVFILGGSICLNIFLFSRAKQYYLELNQTRLDPLGLTILKRLLCFQNREMRSSPIVKPILSKL
jgi:uncharacterized membrane protein HdeD (DUF308 family)